MRECVYVWALYVAAFSSTHTHTHTHARTHTNHQYIVRVLDIKCWERHAFGKSNVRAFSNVFFRAFGFPPFWGERRAFRLLPFVQITPFPLLTHWTASRFCYHEPLSGLYTHFQTERPSSGTVGYCRQRNSNHGCILLLLAEHSNGHPRSLH